ncbi:MAG: tetratricopeptide repeat protein, partial [Myxococcota bacterium]
AFRDGRYPKAVELAKDLLDQPAVRDAARILTARSLRELERYDEAVAVLLPLDGGEESRLLMGLVLSDAGDHSQALPAFRKLSAEHPSKPEYAYYEGQAYARLDRPDDARAAYERALLAPGGHRNSFQALVELDLLARQSDAAQRRITEALARTPDSPMLSVLNGMVAEADERHEEAVRAYRNAIRLDPNLPVARRRLGQLLVQLGQVEEARTQIDRSLRVDRTDLGALMIAGLLSERLGEVRAAMRYYRELLDQNPDFYPAANNLAYLYANQGTELREALRLARIALQAQPDHGGFLDTLGWVHHQRGECDEAVLHLKQAATGSPDRAMIWVHLGLAEERCGDGAEALRAFEAAAKLSPSGTTKALVDDGLKRLEAVKRR